MNFYTRNKKFGLSGIMVLIIYSISLVLAPWFHLHPGDYHSDSTADIYHAHAESFTAHTCGHDETDQRQDKYNHHFDETTIAFGDMSGFARPITINSIKLPKFSTILVLFVKSTTESNSQQLLRQGTFNLSIVQSQQDYCVLAATNLSPPQV